MKPVALLDANALFSAALRDTLVQCCIEGAFRARWTRRLMDTYVPNALVEGFEPLIETLSLPDPDDRHVLAAAIHANAEFLVT